MLHQRHCIEQLRQYIMCSGDVTLIPTKFYPGLGRNYIDSDQLHTCRNFGKLQEWMVDRYEGSTAVKPGPRPGSRWKIFTGIKIFRIIGYDLKFDLEALCLTGIWVEIISFKNLIYRLNIYRYIVLSIIYHLLEAFVKEPLHEVNKGSIYHVAVFRVLLYFSSWTIFRSF